MAVVVLSLRALTSEASDAVGLAGAATCPDWLVVSPARESQRVAPTADAREEVALPVSPEVVGPNKSNVSLIYVARRDVASRNEVAEPLSSVWINLVVVSATAQRFIVPKVGSLMRVMPTFIFDNPGESFAVYLCRRN